jgi:hypothetical protein
MLAKIFGCRVVADSLKVIASHQPVEQGRSVEPLDGLSERLRASGFSGIFDKRRTSGDTADLMN